MCRSNASVSPDRDHPRVTGLRVSEALGLRWEDVDFDSHEINVRFQLDADGQLTRPKTNAGVRTIPSFRSSSRS